MCVNIQKIYIFTLLVIMIPFRIAASSNNPVVSCVADSVIHDSITGTAHITFPISMAEIQSGYGNNARELGRISNDLRSIMSDSTLTPIISPFTALVPSTALTGSTKKYHVSVLTALQPSYQTCQTCLTDASSPALLLRIGRDLSNM